MVWTHGELISKPCTELCGKPCGYFLWYSFHLVFQIEKFYFEKKKGKAHTVTNMCMDWELQFFFQIHLVYHMPKPYGRYLLTRLQV